VRAEGLDGTEKLTDAVGKGPITYVSHAQWGTYEKVKNGLINKSGQKIPGLRDRNSLRGKSPQGRESQGATEKVGGSGIKGKKNA